MKLFRVADASFAEYRQLSFKDENQEKTLEGWIEANPDSLIEDGRIIIIGRQVPTSLGAIIDLLALDRQGNSIVIELKRDRTPRDTLAQALEYASHVSGLDYGQLDLIYQDYAGSEAPALVDQHRTYFELSDAEAVSFNKGQRIVIVGQQMHDAVKQTAKYLCQRGVRVTCVEFSFFKTQSQEMLLSTSIVVDSEPSEVRLPDKQMRIVDRPAFLQSCDENARPVFEAIFSIANSQSLPLHWGTRGFSLNSVVGGRHIALLYGYPPASLYRQSIYTAFADVKRILGAFAPDLARIRDRLLETGLFVPAAGELKYIIGEPISSEQRQRLAAIVTDFAVSIGRASGAEVDSGAAEAAAEVTPVTV